MTNIELPTYRVIRTNEVFGRRSKLSDNPNVPFELTELVSLKKFKVPSQEEIIRFIQESAREFDIKPLGKVELFDPNPLADYLSSLPSEEVKNIANGQDESLEHLKEHSLETTLQRGKVYLDVSNMLIKSNDLDSFPKEGPLGNLPNNWSLRFKLSKEEKLPDRLELDYLIDRGVKVSDVFTAKGDFEDYEMVANQIRILSNTLSPSNRIAQVRDESINRLEEEASLTLGQLYQCTASKESIGGIIGELSAIVQQAFKNMNQENPMGSTGNYFDSGGDPSRN
ncbi:hypothetical protein HOF78_03230 [Candidatus Woesearchaeota archaeon]|jgi:hypothetical protein|nr:hypothetical protein [Candidatus Woesearchaeota archaeon]MBT6044617.1 hypothetical protein [Candidatus Woesearchaeota archaeon]